MDINQWQKDIEYVLLMDTSNPQRWQKKNYEGHCVWYVYLNQVLTNTVRTDGTEEDVARLMTNNNKQYDTIYRGPDEE